MNKRSSNGNGGSLPGDFNPLKALNIVDKYEDTFGLQCSEITEEVEAISKILRGDTQGFLGKTFKEFQPVAYRFNQRGNKFKIKVKTDKDYIHLIGSQLSKCEYELTYATEGNSFTNEL